MPAKGTKRTISEVASSGVVASSSVSNTADIKAALQTLLTVEIPDHKKYKVDLQPGVRCDINLIEPGTLLERPGGLVVLSKEGNNYNVRNLDLHAAGIPNSDWKLGGTLVSTHCWPADHYVGEPVKVTQTELATIFNGPLGDSLCAVGINKLPDIKESAELIRDGSKMIEEIGGSEANKLRLYKELHQRVSHGDYRIMRGHISRDADQSAQKTETGMVRFIDAEAVSRGENGLRIINLRNLQSLTFKLTRFELK